MSLVAVVGSTNPVKIAAARQLLSLYYGHEVVPIAISANPGITKWRSSLAEGQPFGIRQTAFGAIHRVEDCWRRQVEGGFSLGIVAIAFENGLIDRIEVGNSLGSDWLDICFVAIKTAGMCVIKRGDYVPTGFSFPSDERGFDEAVSVYEGVILPKISRGEDLYMEWTRNHVGGPRSRESFLQECGRKALNELSQLNSAHEIVASCVSSGMTASGGLRYGSMLWTRDLAYMAPVYLEKWPKRHFLVALEQMRDLQCSSYSPYFNGYTSFNPLGKIPIVSIPKENEIQFLTARILGTPEEPGFQRQLLDFIKEQQVDLLALFPVLEEDALDVRILKRYYQELLEFSYLVQGDKKPPAPSFALRAFIEETLGDLTPGTRDSEIHYLRAVFSFIKKNPEDKVRMLQREGFADSIAKALFYIYGNVLDLEDGLPLGADSRDIFADLLYDSKVLTNAIFFYQVLEFLLEFSSDLEQTSFRSTIMRAYTVRSSKPTPLHQLASSVSLPQFFQEQLDLLKQSITSKLLFQNGEFTSLDFIPGRRSFSALDDPIHPTPVAGIIKKDNPLFIRGERSDPQSLALAVLSGLIPKQYYDDVLTRFLSADSPIGIRVFVPISGKNEEETLLLQKVKGQVVWPHVSWNIVRALLFMNSEKYVHVAEEQREKLMQLGGCSEWYALDPDTGLAIKGGDPLQGFSATAMLMANEDFYKYYKKPLR